MFCRVFARYLCPDTDHPMFEVPEIQQVCRDETIENYVPNTRTCPWAVKEDINDTMAH